MQLLQASSPRNSMIHSEIPLREFSIGTTLMDFEKFHERRS
jgi:hypothetical protein